MDKAKKDVVRKAIGEKLNGSNGAIIAEYRGLTVAELSELRRDLRESQAEFKVVPNRIAKKAIELECPDCADLAEGFKGPVGVVYLLGDAAQGTKKVLKFEKEHEKFVVKLGLMENKSVSAEQLKAIADLPSKEVLLGQIVGSLVAPHRGLLGVLNGVTRQLVQVINAIKEKKS